MAQRTRLAHARPKLRRWYGPAPAAALSFPSRVWSFKACTSRERRVYIVAYAWTTTVWAFILVYVYRIAQRYIRQHLYIDARKRCDSGAYEFRPVRVDMLE